MVDESGQRSTEEEGWIRGAGEIFSVLSPGKVTIKRRCQRGNGNDDDGERERREKRKRNKRSKKRHSEFWLATGEVLFSSVLSTSFRPSPRKYGYRESSFSKACRWLSYLSPTSGETPRGGLNFYSCANDAAIFRSLKWALKLSGQFRREDVLLFSNIVEKGVNSAAAFGGGSSSFVSVLMKLVLATFTS